MRVLLSGGGTGGHVYPALAVIDALESSTLPPRGGQGTAGFETQQQGTSHSRLEPSSTATSRVGSDAEKRIELLWVGSQDGIEAEVVPRAGIPFTAIDVAGLRGAQSVQLIRNLARMVRATLQAYRIVGRFQPSVIFVTGGYVSAPVVLAGRIKEVPVVIYLPDIVPGLAIRSLAQLATRLAVSLEASSQYLPADKVVVTGYPVRSEFYTTDRAEAVRNLDLDPELKTMLIFGGSRGAQRINWAVAAALESLLDLGQVIHVSGQLDIADMKKRRDMLTSTLKKRYHLFDYLHERMIDALIAADLVISRAGAATLGEFPAAGVPAVLVPYPYAGAHQAENAAVLAESGGAVVVPDAEFTGERLLTTVRGILTDEDRLARMRVSMRQLARPEAAQRIVELLWKES